MKKIVLLTLVLVLLSTAVAVNFTRPLSADETIYIRADGSVEGTTDISSVNNITYIFTDNINDSIVVEKDNIVVDGAGYTLQGTGSGCGIDLTDRSNVTIKNMEIKTFVRGIRLDESSNNTISGNNITNNSEDGIWLGGFGGSSSNTISGNNITANIGDGIWLSESSSNTISGNTITGNNYRGIRLAWSSNNTISKNNITNNDDDGIILNETFNSTVSGNTVTGNNGGGINLGGSSNSTVSGNTVTGNNGGGFWLYESFNITISENTVTGNSWFGIGLGSSSTHNTISGNNITNNDEDGIMLDESSNNTISGNNITGNNYSGISVSESSNYNTMFGNNLTTSGGGISLSYSSNNIIYHNNFVNNTEQVNSEVSTNVWDDGYPSGGNYWSDYKDKYPNATERDGSGIWNTPYVIDQNNQDNYPLTEVIPEFLTWTSMMLILIVLTVAIAIYKRKLPKTPIH